MHQDSQPNKKICPIWPKFLNMFDSPSYYTQLSYIFFVKIDKFLFSNDRKTFSWVHTCGQKTYYGLMRMLLRPMMISAAEFVFDIAIGCEAGNRIFGLSGGRLKGGRYS